MVNPGYVPGQEYQQQQQPPQGNGMAVAGMVLGIIALVLFWVPFLNWLLAILAVIFSAIGMGKAKRVGRGKGAALAGLITGILGAVLGIAFVVFTVFVVRTAGHEIEHVARRGSAQLMVHQLADEAYPQWAAAHPDKQCPTALQDLFAYSVGDHDVQDPWGHRFKMLCGKDAPAEAHGFGVVSNGPDGVPGTDDDIKSW